MTAKRLRVAGPGDVPGVVPLPCPRCAQLEAEIERLREALLTIEAQAKGSLKRPTA